MKKVFDFGKIDYCKIGRKTNSVIIKVELTDEGVFSVSGNIWNNKKSDILCGGEIMNYLIPFLSDNELFQKILNFWKKYQNNDMHAGTRKQEDALKEANIIPFNYTYTNACEYLKSINLYSDNGYIYGSSWLKEEIPENDLEEIKKLLA